MNVRWLKALAFAAAAGATAAVVARSRKESSRLAEAEGTSLAPAPPSAPETAAAPRRPARSRTLPPPTPAPAGPTAAERIARSPEGLEDVAAADSALRAEPAQGRPGSAPAGTPAASEVSGTSAREAAILHAYDVAAERADEGERIVVLAIGDVREHDLGQGNARVVVPLELSHRAQGRVPRTRKATLRVTLEEAPGGWRVAGHEWE